MTGKEALGQLGVPWDDGSGQGCREAKETPEKTLPLENMEKG